MEVDVRVLVVLAGGLSLEECLAIQMTGGTHREVAIP